MIKRILASLVTAAFLFVSIPAQAQQQPQVLTVTQIDVKPEFSVVRDYVALWFVVIPTTEKEKKEVGPGYDEKIIANGSVVIISPHFAITAAHLFGEDVPDGRKGVQRTDEREITYTLVKKDEKHDLALITGDFRCPCAPIASVNPSADQDAYAVGFPLFSWYGLQILTKGLVQGISMGMLATTTAMAPGGSGGGVFVKQNGQYVLAGVISSIGTMPIGPGVLKIQQYMNWITFSISAETMHEFLKGVKLN